MKICKAADFQLVFRQRKWVGSHHFTFYFRKNELDHLRFGVVTAKRNIRLAVSRNRVRRMIREGLRLNQHALAGLDVVVVAKYKADQTQNQELQQCLAKLITRLIKYCKSP